MKKEHIWRIDRKNRIIFVGSSFDESIPEILFILLKTSYRINYNLDYHFAYKHG